MNPILSNKLRRNISIIISYRGHKQQNRGKADWPEGAELYEKDRITRGFKKYGNNQA